MTDEFTELEEERTVEDMDAPVEENMEVVEPAAENLEEDVPIDDEPIDPEMGLSQEEEFAYKIVRSAAKLKGVNINRDAFLRTELAKHCPASVVDAAVKTTTQQAGVSMEIMDKVADASIDLETKKVSGLSALAGIPGGLAMVGTIPADLANYFAHVLRIEQKLAYIYGWPSFLNEDDEIDDETMYRLILFLGVIMQVGSINVSLTNFAIHTAAAGVAKTIEKQALTKTFWYPVLKKVMAALGVKVTKSSFANVVSKGVPLIGGAISGGITWFTYKPGATSLKNHLRLLPQATGGVMDEGDLEAILDAEDERERSEVSDFIDGVKGGAASLAGSAAEGASMLAGTATDAAQSVVGTIGGGLSGLVSLFSKGGDVAEAEGQDKEGGPDEGQAEESPEAPSHGGGADISAEATAPPEQSAATGTSSVLDAMAELRALKELLDEGIIAQSDFDAKKKQLLGI